MNAGGVARPALPAICRLFWLASLRSSFRSADNLSLPDLTRQSIDSRKASFLMDARVKPAHDEKDGAGVRHPVISVRKRELPARPAPSRGVVGGHVVWLGFGLAQDKA